MNRDPEAGDVGSSDAGDRHWSCPRRADWPGAAEALAPEVWQGIAGRSLVRVDDGSPTRLATEVRLAWQREPEPRFFARFEMVDPDIRATFRERNDPVYLEEAVELFLDPFGHGRVYFEIDVSPRGVVFDALILNRTASPEAERDLDTLSQWRCEGLDVAVAVDGEIGRPEPPSRGWTAVLDVPLRSLGLLGREIAPGTSLRGNLFRIDRSADGDELQAWRPTGRLDFHRPWSFGELVLAD